MGQIGEPKKDSQIWSTDSQQRLQGNLMRKETSSQQMMLEQMDIHMEENVSQSLPYNILNIMENNSFKT